MSRYKLEVMLSEELLARLDAAREFEPRASFARRALEAALAVKDPVVETSAGPRARSSFEPGEVVEVPEFPPREVKPDPPAGVPLPKIAKRKW
jgi:hypothetical protein